MIVLAGALLTVEIRAGHADGGPQILTEEEVVVGRASQAALHRITVIRPAPQLCTGGAISGSRRPREPIHRIVDQHLAKITACTLPSRVNRAWPSCFWKSSLQL